MVDGDLHAWADLASTFKNAVEGVKAAVELVKGFRNTGRTSPEDEAKLGAALDAANDSLQLAIAQLAKALGYELCRCAFPPTPMLTVGYISRRPGQGNKAIGDPVHECPKCHRNTAAP